MNDTLNQPWMRQAYLTRIIDALGKDQVRFIGGCVRDALLYREIKDVDMATTLVPEEVIKRLEKRYIKAVPTGIAHGTVTAVSDGIPVEIPTLRSDMECNGRHAKVTFTDSWKEDAERRDFTINALSCSPDGKIHDYTGGMHDLISRRLRFIGDADARCREDYLRILRYFRFFATLGIEEIDDFALSACEREAQGIESLSGERIQHEMLRLLQAPFPLISLRMMEKTRVLEKIFLTSVKTEVMAALEAIEQTMNTSPHALTRLAALCRANHFDKARLEALIQRWKLSNHDKELLLGLCLPPVAVNVANDDHIQKKHLRFYGKAIYPNLLMLAWAMDNQEANDSRYLKLLDWAEQWNIPTFPLQGKDLLAIGIPAGKELGTLLKQAENHWEALHYQPDKKELLAWVKNST